MQLGQRWGNNPDLSEACSLQPQGLPTRCLGKISPAVKENQKKKVGDPVTPFSSLDGRNDLTSKEVHLQLSFFLMRKDIRSTVVPPETLEAILASLVI